MRKKLITIVAMLLAGSGAVMAQGWKMVFKPDENIGFHLTQKDNHVYVTKTYTPENLFIRITDGLGSHNRHYFGNKSYLEIALPSEGYIAIMSEDSASWTQYIYASEEVSRVNFADNNVFFAYTERMDKAIANRVPAENAPKFPTSEPNTTATSETYSNTEIANSNLEFDPNRRKVENSRTDLNTDIKTPEKEENDGRVDAMLQEMKEMNKRLAEMSKQIEDLKKAPVVSSEPEKEAGLGKSTSFIVAATSGFYNVAANCDGCKVDKVSGIPAYPSFGIALNRPKMTLAALLSIGGQLHLPEPGKYRLRPSAGGKAIVIAPKYAFSFSLFSTRSFDSILATAGIGIPVSPKLTPMIEIGYFGGDMHLLPSRQVSTVWAISLVYNMKKSLKVE